MTSIYHPDGFADRVDYAAKCIVTGRTDTRRFFSCFEMNDGDYVVEALIRRAEGNAPLAARLWKALCRVHGDDVHARLKDIPRGQLAAKARAHVEEVNRPRREFDEAHRNAHVVLSARASWDSWVPVGMVGVTATRSADGDCRSFLVPADEYETRGPFGFVIDPVRHAECPLLS